MIPGWVLAALCGVLIYTVVFAAPTAVLIGRAIRLRDAREAPARPDLRVIQGGQQW